MTDSKLKPCPFCGGSASLFASSDHSTAWEGGCCAETGCPATPQVWALTEEAAIAAWNRRPLEAALAALPGDKGQGDGIDEAQFLRDFERNMNACHPAAPILDQVPPIAGRDGASAAPSDEGEPSLDDSQEWAGMDGAIAWHLIYRHADGWSETGSMMNAWLAANADRQVAHSSQAQGELSVNPGVTGPGRMNEENQNG